MSVVENMFERGGEVLIKSVAGVAEAARLAGVEPVVLLDRILSALKDDARVDS